MVSATGMDIDSETQTDYVNRMMQIGVSLHEGDPHAMVFHDVELQIPQRQGKRINGFKQVRCLKNGRQDCH